MVPTHDLTTRAHHPCLRKSYRADYPAPFGGWRISLARRSDPLARFWLIIRWPLWVQYNILCVKHFRSRLRCRFRFDVAKTYPEKRRVTRASCQSDNLNASGFVFSICALVYAIDVHNTKRRASETGGSGSPGNLPVLSIRF